ncbi:MAG: HD domain-containing protein [Candidatus Methanofastidiosia archaeon]
MPNIIDIEYVKRQARNFFNNSKPTHDWSHVLRVHKLCMHIGRKEGANLLVLSVAAYLHDIGRHHEENDISICHAEEGARIARKILEDGGACSDFIELVVHCVKTHRFRNNLVPKSLEAKVLYDADKLDAIGAIGIARAYAYAGEHNQKLITDFDSTERFDYKINHSSHSPVKEYKIKLSNIKNKMLTSEGKRIAEERNRYMGAFFERLKDESRGVL